MEKVLEFERETLYYFVVNVLWKWLSVAIQTATLTNHNITEISSMLVVITIERIKNFMAF
jgi:hypothetical protein